MDIEKDDLTVKQKDYAIFLPALSGFYSTFVGRQRHDPNFVDPTRIPSKFENGIEGMNWLNPQQGYYTYKWSLYSAGHANLDVNKFVAGEDMVRTRDRNNTFLVGDSGGFQIGKGIWEGDWKNPNCPAAAKKRAQVLEWMDTYMDRGMVLDVPAWVTRNPVNAAATGIRTYMDAVKGTEINNEYFMKHRTGACKFLNVLQGGNHPEADDWYSRMKKYCDPKQYDQPFNGWAMGGQNTSDIHLILRRLVALRFDGLLEPGLHDWMHFLGTSKLEWAVLFTDIQRAVRKYHNENFTISFDCASPFLATANGQIYTQTEISDRAKWMYRMTKSVDDKKYATDSRNFRDAVLQDKIFTGFEESPITARTLIKDVCIYKHGDLNKIGKEGKTSWDSFSYAIQMAHNVWLHINSVQEANRQYDAGLTPSMLAVDSADKKTYRQYDHTYFRDIVNEIFATSDRGRAEELVKHYDKYWMNVVGTHGNKGKKTVNPSASWNNLFEEVQDSIEIAPQASDQPSIDDSGLDVSKLDELESNDLEIKDV